MADHWHRTIAGAAAVVAVVGSVVVAVDDGASQCDRIRGRIAGIGARFDESATQAWDDIYTLSEDEVEGTRLAGEYRRLACRPALPGTPTTTVPPPTDPRLPRAADLGPTFEDRPSQGSIEGPGRVGYCDVEMPSAPKPVDRVDAWYLSNDAIEEAATEIVEYASAEGAGAAFDMVARESHCYYEGNKEGGAPAPITVPGADEALVMGFTGENGSHGVAVARVQSSIVVAWVDLHLGSTSAESVSAQDLLALAVRRVKP